MFKIILLILLSIAGIHNTVFTNNFYNTQHFEEHKDIAKKTVEWNKQYGEKNITQAINVSAPYYINYYLEKFNSTIQFEQYNNKGEKDLLFLKNIINKSTTPYFIYAWTKHVPYETFDIIQMKYPYILKQINYSNLSEITLYSQHDEPNSIKEATPVLKIFNGFETKDQLWERDISILDSTHVKNGMYCIKLGSMNEYGPTFSKTISEITRTPFRKIKISICGYMPDKVKDVQLVLSIETKEQENISWTSSKFENYIDRDEWGKVFLTFYMPELKTNEYLLKIYVWNREKKDVYIDDMEIRFYE